MPQLDISTFTSQLFWLCICFFTMLFIMSKLIVPRIAEILALRKRKIDNYLERARAIKEQAEESLNKYQKALEEATAGANKSLVQTQQELNNMINQRQQELAKKLHTQISEGEAEIRKSRDKALAEVPVIARELALDVVKKLGLSEIGAKELNAAIEKTSKE